MSRILTGVGAHFCAAHAGADGILHGHTYEVTAWWQFDGDAVARQAQLTKALEQFDHGTLPANVSLAENLAKSLVLSLDANEVEVRRPLERLYAKAVR